MIPFILQGIVFMVFVVVFARREEAHDAERRELLNRVMARSYEQFYSTTDSFIAANPPDEPRRVLWDETGLLEVEPSED